MASKLCSLRKGEAFAWLSIVLGLAGICGDLPADPYRSPAGLFEALFSLLRSAASLSLDPLRTGSA
jgi:hypothetical protein